MTIISRVLWHRPKVFLCVPEVFWGRPEVFCHAREVLRDAPEVFRGRAEVFCRAPEVFCLAREVFCLAREVLRDAPEVFRGMAEVFCRAPEVFHRAPEVFCHKIPPVRASRPSRKSLGDVARCVYCNRCYENGSAGEQAKTERVPQTQSNRELAEIREELALADHRSSRGGSGGSKLSIETPPCVALSYQRIPSVIVAAQIGGKM